MRRAAKRDRTHRVIRRTLEAMGLLVLDVASVSGLGCDLIAIHLASGRCRLVEAKTGTLAPSARKLTDSEASLLLRAPQVYRVVGSADEAVVVATELLRGVASRQDIDGRAIQRPQDTRSVVGRPQRPQTPQDAPQRRTGGLA